MNVLPKIIWTVASVFITAVYGYFFWIEYSYYY